MERVEMASEEISDRREAAERERLKQQASSPRPLPQDGPRNLNSGLESVRSSNC